MCMNSSPKHFGGRTLERFGPKLTKTEWVVQARPQQKRLRRSKKRLKRDKKRLRNRLRWLGPKEIITHRSAPHIDASALKKTPKTVEKESKNSQKWPKIVNPMVVKVGDAVIFRFRKQKPPERARRAEQHTRTSALAHQDPDLQRRLCAEDFAKMQK